MPHLTHLALEFPHAAASECCLFVSLVKLGSGCPRIRVGVRVGLAKVRGPGIESNMG